MTLCLFVSNLTVNAPVNLTLPNLPAFGLLPGIAGGKVDISGQPNPAQTTSFQTTSRASWR